MRGLEPAGAPHAVGVDRRRSFFDEQLGAPAGAGVRQGAAGEQARGPPLFDHGGRGEAPLEVVEEGERERGLAGADGTFGAGEQHQLFARWIGGGRAPGEPGAAR